MKSQHWLVSTMYEFTHIEKYTDINKIVSDLIRYLEIKLKAKILRFAKEKDGTELYLIEKLGVFGINLEEFFQIKSFFASENDAKLFKTALSTAIEKKLPQEMSKELLENIVVAEAGIELVLD